jgi:phosphonate utilization transcriptional regulator
LITLDAKYMTKSLFKNALAPRAKKSNESARAIALLQMNSLATLVQKELERMIGAGDLPAGSKLNEVDVAQMLGVSRGPVREAFRGLEEAGLVRLEKNRGVFVRQISVEEADEIYEVRAALDEFVGRRLAQIRSSQMVKELREHVERLEKAAARRNLDAYAAANLAFHDRLVELTGNAKLLATYRRLVNELNLYRRSALELNGTVSVSTREHREIVDRIAAGEGASAGKALYEHVMESRERMRQVAASAKPGARAPRAVKNKKA